MNARPSIATFIAWLIISMAPISVAVGAPAPAGAVAVGRGSLDGRVDHPGTGQYLNNARVMLKGTGAVAFTDQAGLFT